ncbi:TPA: TonB-dependent ferric enterobactin receptor CfrA [Campylobacter jejuni]|uniref:TonB-dependent ferric enterobactin receptor CfrA n=1 Tax=Campylobacter TaxID=194 RepID=UPI001271881B|nr:MULTISPECIES: TonB-dependent siderophore receptor [Campylobacter]EAI1517458.1 TonB-dependent siderophore receptor [Campylobacter jejuni]ECP9348300.1 TonB-dependent siderophore receptor [Campylobacter jejuni]EDH2966424.1 TonB-dependent receptor [Campylobacter jejuni]EDO6622673.1 TonB-dependent siderophore receptor [Campylobacter coli]EDP2742773.1 TonB-dependent siderophore receptor [Campylobacter jejuni]
MKKLCLSVCAIGLLASNAISQNVELDSSIISASGFAQDIKEAPATINVISKKELQSKPYRDVAEAIADIPGVDLYASKGKTGSYNITMRGITGYTLVLIDGRRQGIGGEVGPNGFNEISNSFLPPISSIERIEVIKGPMSTLYGSEALGGVVNIITKKVSDKWETSVSLDALLNENKDWGNTYGTSIYSSGPLMNDKLGLTLRFREFYRQQSNVEFTHGSGQRVPGDQAQSPTKANNFNIGTRISYLANDYNTFIFDIDFSRNHYDNKQGQLGTITSPGSTQGSLTGGYADIMEVDKFVTYLSHEGVYENFSITSTLQYNRVSNDGREVVGQATQPFLGQNRDIVAEDIILDTKSVIPLGQSHILSVGGEYRLEKMQDKIANPTNFDQYLLAIFAEDEYSIKDDLRFTFGARYNHHEIFGNNVSPRAYLVYNPTDELTFKGGVSTGFRTPYANRLINGAYNYSGQGRFPIYGNPDLKEETSLNYEVAAIYNNDLFYVSATGFLTNFKDKISTQRYNQGNMIPGIGACGADRCFKAINHGKVEYKGIELGAGISPLDNLNVNFAYTYLDTEVKEAQDKTAIGKPEQDSLKHNIMLKTEYSFYNKFTPWIKGEWQIDRYMGDTNINREYYKDIFLASMGVRYDINKQWSINAAIYNLFDKSFTNSWESYEITNKNSTKTAWVNTYNRIEEGRRMYISINGSF